MLQSESVDDTGWTCPADWSGVLLLEAEVREELRAASGEREEGTTAAEAVDVPWSLPADSGAQNAASDYGVRTASATSTWYAAHASRADSARAMAAHIESSGLVAVPQA